jgi:xylitol oxidase
VTIHFTWKPDWPVVSKLLPVIEKELAPFHARPHWGKLFTMSSTELRSFYRKMPEFIDLSRKYDPQGKFHNEYLIRNIFVS